MAPRSPSLHVHWDTTLGTLIVFSQRGVPHYEGISHRSFAKDLNTSLPRLGSRRPSTLKVPRSRLSRHTQPRTPTVTTAKANGTPLRLTFVTSHLVIEPAMFDDLTFKPACDDVSIVRYTSSTGVVSAATPARLVAEITSPSFLDYELISDFFLTFRAFLEPESLLQMLVARLRWATGRRDEIGMIVHVRSFVALRHWILNYFVDDFFSLTTASVSSCASLSTISSVILLRTTSTITGHN
uniref:N-terminal Ras-GEF domain-containing protein n=1 Tax=Bionectria ochroleuca TaxID=29856 RepID=A0A8H7NL79_BIOOC